MYVVARLTVLFFLVTATTAYSWNALGHRLVAQIAYHHLTPKAKRLCRRYNRAFSNGYAHNNLVDAAAWFDRVRDPNQLAMHYIDIPFSLDGTKLIPPDAVNAVLAITMAEQMLQNNKVSEFEKGLNVRILLHVVGDIHQPLHTISQFSAKHPFGDKGGNYVLLGKNPLAKNLHAYWDKGGGLLVSPHYLRKQLVKKAKDIEANWPCKPEAIPLNPQQWANESHQLAVTYAYAIKPYEKPTLAYQQQVQDLSEQQIAKAGCRLASLLNQDLKDNF